jgi:hypothetical protein
MFAWLLFLPDRLHLVFSSPRHLMVLTGCVIVLEIYCTKWIYPFPDFWSVLSFWDLVSFETSFVVCIMKEF